MPSLRHICLHRRWAREIRAKHFNGNKLTSPLPVHTATILLALSLSVSLPSLRSLELWAIAFNSYCIVFTVHIVEEPPLNRYTDTDTHTQARTLRASYYISLISKSIAKPISKHICMLEQNRDIELFARATKVGQLNKPSIAFSVDCCCCCCCCDKRRSRQNTSNNNNSVNNLRKKRTTNDKFSATIHALRMNDCLQNQWLRYTSIRDVAAEVLLLLLRASERACSCFCCCRVVSMHIFV